MSPASEDTGFEASRAVGDSTFGDAFQEFIALFLQCLLRHQATRMDGPAGENELTDTRETDRAWFLFAPQCRRCCRQPDKIIGQKRGAKFNANHLRRLAANVPQIQGILDASDI